MTRIDQAWLAGIIEGEGYLGWNRHKSKTWRALPVVSVAMTDRDVVVRVAKLFGSNLLGPYGSAWRIKPQYIAQVYGKNAQSVLRLVLPWLCKRRSSRARALLRWRP